MSNDLIYFFLWSLTWIAIASLRYGLDKSKEAIAMQTSINNIQLDINRTVKKEIDLLREASKIE